MILHIEQMMNIQTHNLFPTPICRNYYDLQESLAEKLVPKLLDIEREDNDPVHYSINGYTNYGKDSNTLDLEECESLKSWIVETVNFFSHEIGVPGEFVLHDSWFAINRKNSYHEQHNHLPSVWSGVYYVQANENDAGLTFVNKNLESNWPWSATANNESLKYNASMPISSGIVYVFPSYLDHKVDQQMVDQERIMISFNMVRKNG